MLRPFALDFTVMSLKPGANGRNIVGQQLPTFLDSIYCVRLHTLLHDVGSCCVKFETGQTFSYVQTDVATPNNVGSCWSFCTGLYSILDFVTL